MKAKGAAKERKWLALAIIGAMLLFLLYAAMPLLGGIFGAAIFYVLFKPIYLRVLRGTKNEMLSAMFVVVLSIALIMIPLGYLMYVAVEEAVHLLGDPDGLISQLLPLLPDEGTMVEFVEGHIQSVAAFVQGAMEFLLNSTVSIALNVVVLYLLFYYALTRHREAAETVKGVLPFSSKNSEELMREFTHVIRTTVIGNGAASIALGLLLSAGLVGLGSQHFFFWALVGTIMAFIPIVGIQLIWIPMGIYYIALGDYFSAAAILVWGALLSYVVDGYVRQGVQRKVGELHPLFSLIGLIIGITYFGIIGIIIGPLILAIFVLLARMFREEYLPGW